MKYFILFAFILFSYVAFGQDLIVTTTGDSLKCKIIDVGSDEIQFRFGTSGNVISVKKSETVSHRYNYYAPAPSARTPVTVVEPSSARSTSTAPVDDTPKKKAPPFYTALSLGASSFGSLNFSKGSTGIDLSPTNGTPFVFEFDVAYFMNQNIGIGFKLNGKGGDVTYTYMSTEILSCYDMVMFFGPALYGHFGNDKVSFALNAGIGGLNWSMSDAIIDGDSYGDESYTSVGGFLSAGVNFMFTRHVGLNFKLQTLLGSIECEEDGDKMVRKPAGIGGTLGLCFRF